MEISISLLLSVHPLSTMTMFTLECDLIFKPRHVSDMHLSGDLSIQSKYTHLLYFIVYK